MEIGEARVEAGKEILILYPAVLDLELPIGARSHSMFSISHLGLTLNEINALSFGWGYSANPIGGGHSDFVSEKFPIVHSWWHKLLYGGGIPRGLEF